MKVRYSPGRLFTANPFMLPIVLTGLMSAGVFSIEGQTDGSDIKGLSQILVEQDDSLRRAAKVDDLNAPDVMAWLEDSLSESDSDMLADPGESIVYTVTIFNNGGDTAKGVEFDMSTVDPLTAFNGDLSSTVVAIGDSFDASSSTALVVPSGSGLLVNDIDLDGDISSVTAPATSTNGATLAVSNDGSFTYTPAKGSSGLDTFQYVIMDDDGNKDSAIVKISLSSSIFFVDDDASPGGDGSLASPFKTIAELNASSGPAAGDTIYFYSGSYTGSVTLLADQRLFGQGSALTSGSLSIAPGADPVITATSPAVTLAAGSIIRGLTLNTGASGMGILGTGVLGTVSIENTTIQLEGAGTGVSLSPTSGTITFDVNSPILADASPTGATAVNVASNGATITFGGAIANSGTGVSVVNTSGIVNFTGGLSLSTGSNTAFSASGGTVQVSGTNTVTTGAATAVSLVNTNLGTGVTFQSISSSGTSTNGVVLSGTSGGAFTVTGTGSTDGSGGTIQNKTQRAFTATSTSNPISLSNMSFTTNGGSNPGGTCSSSDPSGCSAHLHFASTTGAVTLTNVDLSGGTGQGVLGSAVSGGFTYQNGSTTNVGDGDFEDGINLNGVSGTVTVTNSVISGSSQDNLFVSTAAGATTLAITNNTISNVAGAFKDDGIQIECATGTLNADVTGNTIGAHTGRSLEAVVSAVGMIASLDATTNSLTSGAALVAANSASLTFNLNNNPSIGSPTGGPGVSVVASNTSTVHGRINNNIIAPSSASPAIDVTSANDATGVLDISSNTITISSTGETGISVRADGVDDNPGASPELDVTMANNFISATAGGFPLEGVFADAVLYGTTCVDVTNTSVAVSFSSGFFGRSLSSGKSTLQMEGFTTTIGAWWTAGGNAGSTSSSGSGTFTAGTCTTVSHPTPEANPIVNVESEPDFEEPASGLSEPDQADVLDPNLASMFDEAPSAFATEEYAAAGKSSAVVFGANIGSLPPGKTIVLVGSFTVLNYSAGVTSIVNQGVVTGSNFATVSTDDPDEAGANDPTSTQVDEGSALPVELVSFNAIVDQTDVVLQWQTASEINNAGFDVERQNGSILNGGTGNVDAGWERVAFVEGEGTTNSPRTYIYTVIDAEPGLHRFRLKQIDFDGAFEYSPIVEALVEVPRELSLSQNYPNPFNPRTNINFTVPASGRASLRVFSMLGRQVATLFEGEAEPGRLYTRSFNAERFATGQYVYVLDFEGMKVTRTMLVVR